MGEKEILSITDAAELDAHINSLMECKLLSEEDVESLCKRVSRACMRGQGYGAGDHPRFRYEGLLAI